MSNFYDDIIIDIKAQHQRLNSDPNIRNKVPLKKGNSRYIIDKLLKHFKLYDKLVESGFIRGWFNSFNHYWTSVLQGRPLRLHDFFYLHSYYRMKFQQVSIKDNIDSDELLEGYTHPANIYQIFSCSYIFALRPFSYDRFAKYLKPGSAILEYGCGLAPIVTSLITYSRKYYRATIADIPQFTYHFAKWNLRNTGVKFIDIDPERLPSFAEKYDCIFLIQVLEHLLNPFATIKHLTEYLKPGGYLIFDFILTEAEGLDTIQAIKQRKQVLDYIEEKFNIIEGKIFYNKSMQITVVQKHTLN